MTRIALALTLLASAPAQATTGCFIFTTDRDGWGSIQTRCIIIDYPREPRIRHYG